MFQTLGILGLLATVLLVGAHALFLRKRGTPPADRADTTPRLRFWDRLIYALAVLSIVGLALTGLFCGLVYGAGSLNGWALFFHFAVAPAFILCLLALVLLWADRCRFGVPPDEQAGGRRFGTADKALFWVIAVLGLVAIGTILASMLPIFSSESQDWLYALHRYSALLLTMALIVHGYAMFLSRAPRAPRPSPAGDGAARNLPANPTPAGKVQ